MGVAAQLGVIATVMALCEVAFRVVCWVVTHTCCGSAQQRAKRAAAVRPGYDPNPINFASRVCLALLCYGAGALALRLLYLDVHVTSAFAWPTGGAARTPASLWVVFALAAAVLVPLCNHLAYPPPPLRLPRAWRERHGTGALPRHIRRVNVGGITGSGKTTLALAAADAMGVRCIDLDPIHWLPNWTPRPTAEFQAAVRDALESTRERVTPDPCDPVPARPAECAYVVSGNYMAIRSTLWRGDGDTTLRTQALVWLDLPWRVSLWRLTQRIVQRARSQAPLWPTDPSNPNREGGWIHLKFWSEESLYHWQLKTLWAMRRGYVELFGRPENAHMHIVRFDRPCDADRWLQLLRAERNAGASSASPNAHPNAANAKSD